MTEGEIIFYLREIHSFWGTSTVSSEKLNELEQAGLIERRSDPEPAVRLTPQGVRCKDAARARRLGPAPTAQNKTSAKRRKKHVIAPPRRWAPLLAW